MCWTRLHKLATYCAKICATYHVQWALDPVPQTNRHAPTPRPLLQRHTRVTEVMSSMMPGLCGQHLQLHWYSSSYAAPQSTDTPILPGPTDGTHAVLPQTPARPNTRPQAKFPRCIINVLLQYKGSAETSPPHSCLCCLHQNKRPQPVSHSCKVTACLNPLTCTTCAPLRPPCHSINALTIKAHQQGRAETPTAGHYSQQQAAYHPATCTASPSRLRTARTNCWAAGQLQPLQVMAVAAGFLARLPSSSGACRVCGPDLQDPLPASRWWVQTSPAGSEPAGDGGCLLLIALPTPLDSSSLAPEAECGLRGLLGLKGGLRGCCCRCCGLAARSCLEGKEPCACRPASKGVVRWRLMRQSESRRL